MRNAMTTLTTLTTLTTRNSHAAQILRFGGAFVPPAFAAPPFDPVDLPFSIVLEARVGRTLDSGGSPASLPGDPVGLWQNRAVGGADVVQNTFSARPIYQIVGGKPVLRFTADDFFAADAAAGVPGFGDVVTAAACIEMAGSGLRVIAAVGSSVEQGAFYLAVDSANKVGFSSIGSGFAVVSANAIGAGTHTIIARKSGAFLSLRVDGVEVGDVLYSPTFAARTGPLTIGNAAGYSLNFNGGMRFFAAAPDTSLSDTDCMKVEEYCRAL